MGRKLLYFCRWRWLNLLHKKENTAEEGTVSIISYNKQKGRHGQAPSFTVAGTAGIWRGIHHEEGEIGIHISLLSTRADYHEPRNSLITKHLHEIHLLVPHIASSPCANGSAQARKEIRLDWFSDERKPWSFQRSHRNQSINLSPQTKPPWPQTLLRLPHFLNLPLQIDQADCWESNY